MNAALGPAHVNAASPGHAGTQLHEVRAVGLGPSPVASVRHWCWPVHQQCAAVGSPQLLVTPSPLCPQTAAPFGLPSAVCCTKFEHREAGVPSCSRPPKRQLAIQRERVR